MALAAAAAAAAAAAGPSILQRDQELFAKLATLQAQVLSGAHPSFNLPDATVQKFKAAGALVLPPDSHRPATTAANAALVQPAPPASSSFDLPPLQSPAEHVRAQIALKRQRIEISLRDGNQQDDTAGVPLAKRSAKEKEEESMSGPSVLSYSNVVERAEAKEAMRAADLDAANANPSVSPIDEDSYYSSKAPASWSDTSDKSEEGELTPDEVGASAANFAQRSANEDGKPLLRLPRPTTQSRPRRPFPLTPSTSLANTAMREESYSPPPPDNVVGQRGSFLTRGRESESYSPPSPDLPTSRTDMAPPLAPRSQRNPAFSRPLPQGNGNPEEHLPKKLQKKGKSDGPGPKFLNKRERKEREALLKGQQGAQQQQQQQQQQQSHRQPAAQGAQNGRKRRRDDDADAETSTRQVSGRQGGHRQSPQPPIKQEPVSPAPSNRLPRPPPVEEEAESGPRIVLRDNGLLELVGEEQSVHPARAVVRATQQRPLEDYSTVVPHTGRHPGPDGGLQRAVGFPITPQYQSTPQPADIRYVRLPTGEFVPEHLVQALSSSPYATYGRDTVPNEYRPAMPPSSKRRLVVLDDDDPYDVAFDRSRISSDAMPHPPPPPIPPPPPPQWRNDEQFMRSQRAASRYIESPSYDRFSQLDGVYDVNQPAYARASEPGPRVYQGPFQFPTARPAPPVAPHQGRASSLAPTSYNQGAPPPLPPPPPPPPPPQYMSQYGARAYSVQPGVDDRRDAYAASVAPGYGQARYG